MRIEEEEQENERIVLRAITSQLEEEEKENERAKPRNTSIGCLTRTYREKIKIPKYNTPQTNKDDDEDCFSETENQYLTMEKKREQRMSNARTREKSKKKKKKKMSFYI